MALIFYGSTTCSLCGCVLKENENILAIPAAIANKADPLYKFNDQAFHLECLKKQPEYKELELMLSLLNKHKSSKICFVCNLPITKPDDYIGLGLLTSDNSNPMFKYNFLEFHKQHFYEWEERKVLAEYLKIQKESHQWVGDSLDFILG
ncbi:hypothetical protein GO495_15505 [Chitinophaga oryziterrae]|uniref:Uncharacterized protein n=1 Tax=Chitinophaga oryziterrae TaxID=1031224 RepID=A0A6N8J9S6_9BACT|nr:hypothetical protein [Chitinophaga oryziterrae]MVT41997.1 hypothetical protein [Chitinophaga oryziterrae]